MKNRSLTCGLLLGLLWVFFAPIANAQPQSPKLLCADVQNDGSVILTWQQVPNINNTNFYRIYRDVGSGFVEIVNNLPYTTTTYTDNGANALTQSIKYRVQVHGSQSSAPGNTVSTLLLSLLPSGSSIAHLSWNQPFENMPGTGHYRIYRSVEGEAYQVINDVSAGLTTYVDTLFGLCDLVQPNKQFVVDYKVAFVREECEMFSSPAQGEFRDNLGPGLVSVETVTTDPHTGYPEIYWYPITNAPDLKDYTIRTIEAGTETTVGVVPAFQQTFFIHVDGNQNSETTFQMIAHDSCNVESGYEKQYTTIRAKATYKNCELMAKLDWTKYKGWEEGVALYNLYLSENGGSYQLVETFSADEASYNLPVEPNYEYCFYIEAISNGSQRPSTTNSFCFKTDYPQVAAFNYLNRVTTLNDKRIQIDLLQDLNSIGTTYELLRAEEGNFFESMGTYPMDQNNTMLTVTDNDVNADVKVYRYKWKAYDGCGKLIGESNVGRNMVLNVFTSSDTLINSLSWSHYGNWDGDVEEYQIHRKLGQEAGFTLYEIETASTSVFSDDVNSYIMDAGEFCYKIVAVEGENTYNSQTVSESNTVCVTQSPLMWIPNAIVLDGYNKVFAPVAGFIDFESYQMEIYNKWGEKLFVSHNINDGWDGTYKGKQVPKDYYRYIIIYRDGAGKSFIKQGVLYVLSSS